MNQNKLYNYLFHFSEYTQKWAAFPRDMKEAYFNIGRNKDRSKEHGIIYANKVEDLIDFLTK